MSSAIDGSTHKENTNNSHFMNCINMILVAILMYKPPIAESALGALGLSCLKYPVSELLK